MSTSTAGSSARSRARRRTPLGDVALVAAGPGDPALITVRAAALLESAGLIVVDPEVSSLVERFAAPDAECVVAVDDAGEPLARAARVKLVVEAARAGRAVVRLYSGDPLLDGTIAAEGADLAKAKIPFEIAPGVSPITAVPAYAGITLSSADTRVIDALDPRVDIAAVDSATLVILNAVDRATEIAKAQLAAGRPAQTPVALVLRGSTVDQRTLTSSLADLGALVKSRKPSGAGVMVIGTVVEQRAKLDWFEVRPLFGWQVLVPRTQDRGDDLCAHIRRHGAVPVEVPTISVEPPRTPHQVDRAITGLVDGRYEWVVFTSVNAVRAVREKIEDRGLDARCLSGLKIAAVGADTVAALVGFGVRPDLTPSGDQTTRGLLEEWPMFDPVSEPINRVFLPRADIATETLVAGMSELGWEVEDITAYRTVRAAPPPAATREAIKSGGFDAVLFTSSSTVRNLVGIAGKPHASTVVACIGPQTAKTAEEHGLRVDVLSEEPDIAHLVEALAAHGEALRIAALESGDPSWRPSARRATARRKAT